MWSAIFILYRWDCNGEFLQPPVSIYFLFLFSAADFLFLFFFRSRRHLQLHPRILCRVAMHCRANDHSQARLKILRYNFIILLIDYKKKLRMSHLKELLHPSVVISGA